MLGPHTPLSQTKTVFCSAPTSLAKTVPWPGPLFLKGPRPPAVYSQKLSSLPTKTAAPASHPTFPNPLSQAELHPPCRGSGFCLWLLVKKRVVTPSTSWLTSRLLSFPYFSSCSRAPTWILRDDREIRGGRSARLLPPRNFLCVLVSASCWADTFRGQSTATIKVCIPTHHSQRLKTEQMPRNRGADFRTLLPMELHLLPLGQSHSPPSDALSFSAVFLLCCDLSFLGKASLRHLGLP